MEEENREIKAPPRKQLIMDIGKTKYTVNLHFKQGDRRNIQGQNTKANQERNREDINLSKKFRLCP
ncbi:hypothetical protein [Streptococcus ruminantium]|uniref:hypothetical protein n=1 Tax=Streptococcus ruminantium TaxID=1917441 RepID=UPI0012DD8B37|nr:hypothetical protein [Streptococcus ruminantium]